ncbi:MAG: diacylglycerol kinase family lipid kinase [Thalassobaculaceae bacterium]|nr:diacylglycerol kinase family lipid kinase [Thalassobaculaceae bacterium]
MRTDSAATSKNSTGDPEAAPEAQGDRSPAAIRRALIIFNRNAGGGRKVARLEEVVALLREAGVDVEVHETAFAGDAQQTAADAKTIGSGPDVVICAGGDGTINEVVNGLAGGNTPLALLPIGTANVLAAEIGLETDPQSVVVTILSGVSTQVHLGMANDRYFALMAGVGLDAEVVATVDVKLKRRTGKLAYALATAKRWAAYRNHRYRVTIDGTVHEAASAIVANGHYYAGKFICAEDARITEPGLHVCLFEKPGRWQAIYYMMALFGGFLDRLNTYRVIPGRVISVENGREGPVQGDGDIITRLPVSMSVAAETIFLRMPPKPT